MAAGEANQSERLDQYVARQLPGKSRAFAAKLIEQGSVSVNGEVAGKAGYKLRVGEQVEISYHPEDAAIPDIELEVLYEDEDCMVVNKPAGILSHSKGEFNPEATVATWLKSRVTGLEGERAGIVHRLDRPTSGVMICAKTPESLKWLQKQFSQRRVKKTYQAVVVGHLKEPSAIIDMPIERNPKKPQTFRVGSNGKAAVTKYKTLETGRRFSLLELNPETGRTHQLRVHLQQLGHPIAGDTLYGGPAEDRLYLHAHKLEVTLPNRSRKIFDVPVPPQFLTLVES